MRETCNFFDNICQTLMTKLNWWGEIFNPELLITCCTKSFWLIILDKCHLCSSIWQIDKIYIFWLRQEAQEVTLSVRPCVCLSVIMFNSSLYPHSVEAGDTSSCLELFHFKVEKQMQLYRQSICTALAGTTLDLESTVCVAKSSAVLSAPALILKNGLVQICSKLSQIKCQAWDSWQNVHTPQLHT